MPTDSELLAQWAAEHPEYPKVQPEQTFTVSGMTEKAAGLPVDQSDADTVALHQWADEHPTQIQNQIGADATHYLERYRAGDPAIGELSPEELHRLNLLAQKNEPWNVRFVNKLFGGDYGKAWEQVKSDVGGTFKEFYEKQKELAAKGGKDISNLNWGELYNDFKSGLQNEKNAIGGAAKGVIGLGPVAADVGSAAIQGVAGAFLPPDAEQNFDAALNAATDAVAHGVEVGTQKIADVTGTNLKAPEARIAQNVAPLAVPIGGGEALAGGIEKAASKIVTAADKAGAMGQKIFGDIVSKTAPVTAEVATRIPEAAIGAVTGAEFGHPIAGAIVGGMIRPKQIETAVENVIKAKGEDIARAARDVLAAPEGVTPINAVQDGLKARLNNIQEAIDIGRSRLSPEDLDLLNKAQANPELLKLLKGDAKTVFGDWQRAQDIAGKINILEQNKGFAQFQRQASEMAVRWGLNSATGAAIMGGMAGASTPPGETEAVPAGVITGAAAGFGGSLVGAPLEVRRAIAEHAGRRLISYFDKTQGSNPAMDSLDPTMQDYLKKVGALALANGKKVEVLSGDEFRAKFGDQMGNYGNNVASINADYVGASGKAMPHEITHALDQAAGLSKLGTRYGDALDAMVNSTDPKVQEELQKAKDYYERRWNGDLSKDDPNFKRLTQDGLKAEITADLGSDILGRQSPEGIYGGKSILQNLEGKISAALGRTPTSTGEFNFPVTDAMHAALTDALFDAGRLTKGAVKGSDKVPVATAPEKPAGEAPAKPVRARKAGPVKIPDQVEQAAVNALDQAIQKGKFGVNTKGENKQPSSAERAAFMDEWEKEHNIADHQDALEAIGRVQPEGDAEGPKFDVTFESADGSVRVIKDAQFGVKPKNIDPNKPYVPQKASDPLAYKVWDPDVGGYRQFKADRVRKIQHNGETIYERGGDNSLPADTGKYEGPESKQDRTDRAARRMGLSKLGQGEYQDDVSGARITGSDAGTLREKLDSARFRDPDAMAAMPSNKELADAHDPKDSIDWAERHGLEKTPEGKYVLYHGTPITNDFKDIAGGSLLATTPKDAEFYAKRDRGLRSKDVKVIRMELSPEEFRGSVFGSVNRPTAVSDFRTHTRPHGNAKFPDNFMPAPMSREVAQNAIKDLNDKAIKLRNELGKHVDKPDSKELYDVQDKLRSTYNDIHKIIEYSGEPRELVVIGGGPGGLKSAEHAAYEGLDVVLLEKELSTGGPASKSLEIKNASIESKGQTGRNYFTKMRSRVLNEGAQIKNNAEVTGLSRDPNSGIVTVTLKNGQKIEAHNVIVATGTSNVPIKGLEKEAYNNAERLALKTRDNGVGVIYGGGNSASQAALSTASTGARKIHVVARSPFSKGMSAEQLARLREHPNVQLHQDRTIQEVVRNDSGDISHVILDDGTKIPTDHVEIFGPRQPNTEQFDVAKNDHGVILTGDRLLKTDTAGGILPGQRLQGEYETSMGPNVMAIGDIIRDPALGDPRRIDVAVGDAAHATAKAVTRIHKLNKEGKLDTIWNQSALRQEGRQERPRLSQLGDGSQTKTSEPLTPTTPNSSLNEDIRSLPAPETPQFKQWFKDSKVTDEDGNPKVVYHGTAPKVPFSAFDRKKLGSATGMSEAANTGFFFTDEPKSASYFAEFAAIYNNNRLYNKMRGSMSDFNPPSKGLPEGYVPERAQIIPAYLSIQNPYKVDSVALWKKFMDVDPEGQSAIMKYLRNRGHDGIELDFSNDQMHRFMTEITGHSFFQGSDPNAKVWIAFEPEQIKSSIANKGTFDPKNPDITSMPPPVVQPTQEGIKRPYPAGDMDWWGKAGHDHIMKRISFQGYDGIKLPDNKGFVKIDPYDYMMPAPTQITHYSEKPDLKELDPSFHGTGSIGKEIVRKKSFPDYLNRSYAYLPEGEKEAVVKGNLKYVGQVDKDKLYDIKADPQGLWDKAVVDSVADGNHPNDRGAALTKFENLIKDAGYEGYHDGKVAALYNKTPVERAMPPVMNIGLATNDGKGITPEEAIKTLESHGLKVTRTSIKQSGTEPTLVASLDRDPTPEEAHSISASLNQEAVAVRHANGQGELYGPRADNWKPFNPDYFLDHDKYPMDELARLHQETLDARARGDEAELARLAKLQNEWTKKYPAIAGADIPLSGSLDGYKYMPARRNYGRKYLKTGVDREGEPTDIGTPAFTKGLRLRTPAQWEELRKQDELKKNGPPMEQGELFMPRPDGFDPDFHQIPPAPDSFVQRAIGEAKAPLVGAHRNLERGTPVDVRIDIPAYTRNGVYVQTVHKPGIGKVQGYDSIVRLDGPVTLSSNEKGALKVKEGSNKFPLAVVKGEYNPSRTLPSDINDTQEWTPAGFNPQKHSFFYDKETGTPVVSGSEAVMIGNTAYIRDAHFGDPKDNLYMPPEAIEKKAQELNRMYPDSPKVVFKRKKNGQYLIDAKGNPVAEQVPYNLLQLGQEAVKGTDQNPEDHLAGKLVDEYKRVQDNPDISKAKGWYKETREKIVKLVGSVDKAFLFAKLLAATSKNTPVRENFKNTLDAFNRAEKGEFNKQIEGYLDARDKFQKGELLNKNGQPMRPSEFRKYVSHHFSPKKGNGALYSMNSMDVLDVLAGTWDSGLKTTNFAGNLSGKTLRATIDLWAARNARRLLGGSRIHPIQEGGVRDPDFKFTQNAYDKAAAQLGMDPDDLQAVLWFAEKDHWKQSGFGKVQISDDYRDFMGYTSKDDQGLRLDIPRHLQTKEEQKKGLDKIPFHAYQ
jgi:thioredoxin reductase